MGGDVEMKKRPVFPGFLPGDAVVIVVLAVAALLSLVAMRRDAPASSFVIVTESGSTGYPLDRTGEYTVSSAGYTLTVAVENGSVRVTESDCPGGDCVQSGAITRVGQSIVCIPARVAIRMMGEAAYDADWILP